MEYVCLLQRSTTETEKLRILANITNLGWKERQRHSTKALRPIVIGGFQQKLCIDHRNNPLCYGDTGCVVWCTSLHNSWTRLNDQIKTHQTTKEINASSSVQQIVFIDKTQIFGEHFSVNLLKIFPGEGNYFQN